MTVNRIEEHEEEARKQGPVRGLQADAVGSGTVEQGHDRIAAQGHHKQRTAKAGPLAKVGDGHRPDAGIDDRIGETKQDQADHRPADRQGQDQHGKDDSGNRADQQGLLLAQQFGDRDHAEEVADQDAAQGEGGEDGRIGVSGFGGIAHDGVDRELLRAQVAEQRDDAQHQIRIGKEPIKASPYVINYKMSSRIMVDVSLENS